MDKVKMYHPSIPHTKDQPAEVTRQSYDAVWKSRGWRLWPPKATKKEKIDGNP
jgi:hypothetical protein